MTHIRQLHLGHVNLPESHPRARDMTCEIYSYAIIHPDGIIVVYTGPRVGHSVVDKLYSPQITPIVDALNHAGFDEREVHAVVNTHLHFDHCGQNQSLPHAPIWITEAELEVSTTKFYTVPEWAHTEPGRLRLSSDNERLADGVHLLHTPGHTPRASIRQCRNRPWTRNHRGPSLLHMRRIRSCRRRSRR